MSASPAEPPIAFSIYFLLRDQGGTGTLVPVSRGTGTLVPVSRTAEGTRQVAMSAIRSLLRGPTTEDARRVPPDTGPFTLIPANTLLLGLDLDLADGVATVDLSREFETGAGSSVFARRLAQVVFTLTQFRGIQGVSFKLDGEPVHASAADGTLLDRPATRTDFLPLLPAIFVDTPGWGATVDAPVTVSGLANVFEATFRIELVDRDGTELAQRSVTATCGTGCWGSWEVTLDLDRVGTTEAWLSVWVPSAKDGTREELRRYPLRIPPGG